MRSPAEYGGQHLIYLGSYRPHERSRPEVTDPETLLTDMASRRSTIEPRPPAVLDHPVWGFAAPFAQPSSQSTTPAGSRRSRPGPGPLDREHVPGLSPRPGTELLHPARRAARNSDRLKSEGFGASRMKPGEPKAAWRPPNQPGRASHPTSSAPTVAAPGSGKGGCWPRIAPVSPQVGEMGHKIVGRQGASFRASYRPCEIGADAHGQVRGIARHPLQHVADLPILRSSCEYGSEASANSRAGASRQLIVKWISSAISASPGRATPASAVT